MPSEARCLQAILALLGRVCDPEAARGLSFPVRVATDLCCGEASHVPAGLCACSVFHSENVEHAAVEVADDGC